MDGTGKFAIKGFPKKLGLLLYGPPGEYDAASVTHHRVYLVGTGKTSIIKALGSYTGRHVVSINLRQIGTNQELFDLFFDLEFHTGEQSLLCLCH